MKLQCCKQAHHLLILYVPHILCGITLSVYLNYSEHVKQILIISAPLFKIKGNYKIPVNTIILWLFK